MMIELTTFDERKAVYINPNLIEAVSTEMHTSDSGSVRTVSVVVMSSGRVHIVNESVNQIIKSVSPDSKTIARRRLPAVEECRLQVEKSPSGASYWNDVCGERVT